MLRLAPALIFFIGTLPLMGPVALAVGVPPGAAVSWLALAAIAVLFGWIYEKANARHLVTDAAEVRISAAIVEEMTSLAGLEQPVRPTEPRTVAEAIRPALDRLIDRDPTSAALRQRIRKQRIKWTAAADVVVVLPWQGMLYLAAGLLIDGDPRWFVAALGLFVVAYMLERVSYAEWVRRHVAMWRALLDRMAAVAPEEIRAVAGELWAE